jgi:hypothetical protein
MMSQTKVKPFKEDEEVEEDESAFFKFCGETSLHGWPYFNREMSLVWRTIWILFVIVICGTSVFVLVKISHIYFTVPSSMCGKLVTLATPVLRI